jgi:hypothetical protein
MKRLIGTLGIAGLLLSSSVLVAQAQSAADQAAKRNILLHPQSAAALATVNNQSPVACNLCFTCGGDWPVFAGATTSGTVSERGGGCSGGFVTRTDNPFLCCR